VVAVVEVVLGLVVPKGLEVLVVVVMLGLLEL
jgi:hypothetical protein